MGTYSKNFFRCMKECKSIIALNRDTEAGKVWLSVKTFAESGDYSSYKKASALVKLVIGGYSDTYIADSLGIEEATVRIHKRNISNELYKLLGNDFFDLLKDYNANKKEIDIRLSNIKNFNLKSSDVLPSEVLAFVNRSTVTNPINYIDLKECKSELSFIVRHSTSAMQRGAAGLDINKLHYLLSIIDSNLGTPDDRCYVLNLMTGGKLENEND